MKPDVQNVVIPVTQACLALAGAHAITALFPAA